MQRKEKRSIASHLVMDRFFFCVFWLASTNLKKLIRIFWIQAAEGKWLMND